MPAIVQTSPFFDFAINSLSDPALFDMSINLLCDLIHETQELGDNLAVIQAIVPRLWHCGHA
jgi:transportin-3